MQRRRSPSSFPRFLCAASLPLSFPGHPVECAGVSAQLTADGIFSGLREQEEQFRKENAFQKPYSNPQAEIGLFVADAFNRIWKVADAYRKGELTEEQALSGKVLKAILHYGGIEAGRPNDGPRFHASCFAIPTAAVNTYFCYLKQMDDAEGGKGGTLLQEACDMLKTIALQAWTQPLRHDETDGNVVSISRFRNHVWWVGGNALAYRSLLPVAAMYRSIPMIDLLAEVCQRGISMTSQTTYSDAFWTEGFTADGAGWGHGKQCLIWGYPIDGTSNALKMLNMLKGSPWPRIWAGIMCRHFLISCVVVPGIIIRDIAFLAWTVARMYIIPQSFPSLMPECWITLSATGWTLSPPKSSGNCCNCSKR